MRMIARVYSLAKDAGVFFAFHRRGGDASPVPHPVARDDGAMLSVVHVPAFGTLAFGAKYLLERSLGDNAYGQSWSATVRCVVVVHVTGVVVVRHGSVFLTRRSSTD